ncbi:MAG: hypothetical protein WCP65_07890 [Bacteroidota bacterium]
MNEINLEFEPRNNKEEFKRLLKATIFCLIISVIFGYQFSTKLSKSKLGENAEISINQIAYIVIFFALVLYAGYLSTRNLMLSIREYIISEKYSLNYICIVISAINLIGILAMIIAKAIFVAGL